MPAFDPGFAELLLALGAWPAWLGLAPLLLFA